MSRTTDDPSDSDAGPRNDPPESTPDATPDADDDPASLRAGDERVVALTWTLSDAQGQRLDELAEPTEFLVGGDDLLPKVDGALRGRRAGETVEIALEPDDAFGEYDAALVCFEDRALFPDGVEPGMQFEGLPEGSRTPDMPADRIYAVTEVYPSHVVLDGNHPLAGLGLRLAIRVASVRAASRDEIDAGSVATGALGMFSAPARVQ